MRKSDFVRYVKSIIKPYSVTEQINALEKMKTWLDELIKEKKEKNIYCSNCKKYSSESRFKKVYEHEVRHQAIYIDAGYGDDDTHGEVEYFVTYSVCPCCGYKKEIEKRYLKTLSEYTRDGRKIR